jgi:DNA (cytosine-5)-methyltransferase 1
MRILDLFCGAGGAAMGYHRAGFEVVGVDIKPQPHYPFPFILGDAIDVLTRMLAGEKFLASDGNCYGIDDFNAIHASPPCQAFSTMTNGRWQDRVSEHPKLIEPIRRLLIASGKPYVIENVEGARGELINPILLCGTMFKLETEAGNQLRRHRYFECSFCYLWTPPCQHNSASAIGVYGGGQNPARRKRRYKAEGENTDFGIVARSFVMGVDWMTGKELNESIPPAYTEFMGRQLAEHLRAQ